MHIHRSAVGVVVHTPAKLNLLFEVLGKRDDGYHEIETLMCPIDLYDTLLFQDRSDGKLTLSCHRPVGLDELGMAGLGNVPDGPENLVIRAVELVRRRTGVCRGAKMQLIKRIPASAGLGGGSSDAAAALSAANAAWRLDRPPGELADWAAELGSDVPFFLTGGPAVCRGRGERVEPHGGLGTLNFVVVKPPEGLSTPAVYSECRPATQPQTAGQLVDALRRGDLCRAGRLFSNRLQPAAERLSHWIGRLRDEFARLDFLGHALSGSGSAYFGLCRNARQARRLARILAAKRLGLVFAARSCC